VKPGTIRSHSNKPQKSLMLPPHPQACRAKHAAEGGRRPAKKNGWHKDGGILKVGTALTVVEMPNVGAWINQKSIDLMNAIAVRPFCPKQAVQIDRLRTNLYIVYRLICKGGVRLTRRGPKSLNCKAVAHLPVRAVEGAGVFGYEYDYDRGYRHENQKCGPGLYRSGPHFPAFATVVAACSK